MAHTTQQGHEIKYQLRNGNVSQYIHGEPYVIDVIANVENDMDLLRVWTSPSADPIICLGYYNNNENQES